MVCLKVKLNVHTDKVMTIKELKEQIKDIPDDKTVGIWDSENDCECSVEDKIEISEEKKFDVFIILKEAVI